jgi:hypothetical protein
LIYSLASSRHNRHPRHKLQESKGNKKTFALVEPKAWNRIIGARESSRTLVAVSSIFASAGFVA